MLDIGFVFHVVLAMLAYTGHVNVEPQHTDEKTELYWLMNGERGAAGEAALPEDSRLDAVAQARVEDMWDRGYFGHLDPFDPLSYVGLIAAQGITQYAWAGENLGRWSGGPERVAAMLGAMMASDTHRANILAPDYNMVGIGSDCREVTCIFAIIFLDSGP